MEMGNFASVKSFNTEALPRHDSINQDNQHSISNPNFAARKTSIAENAAEYIDQNIHNSLDKTCELLENRKIENTTEQANILRALNRNNNIIIIALLAIVPFIITAAVVSPFFAIGIAASVILSVILLSVTFSKIRTHDKLGIQNMGIDMLVAGIKDNIPTNNAVSLKENTELLNIFNNAVNSVDKQGSHLIASLREYYVFNHNDATKQQLLKNEVTDFYHLIFDNAELTAYLEKLNFDASAVKDGIYEYIDNLTVEQITASILNK